MCARASRSTEDTANHSSGQSRYHSSIARWTHRNHSPLPYKGHTVQQRAYLIERAEICEEERLESCCDRQEGAECLLGTGPEYVWITWAVAFCSVIARVAPFAVIMDHIDKNATKRPPDELTVDYANTFHQFKCPGGRSGMSSSSA